MIPRLTLKDDWTTTYISGRTAGEAYDYATLYSELAVFQSVRILVVAFSFEPYCAVNLQSEATPMYS